MKTLSDHPLLIGAILARSEKRSARRTWLRRLFRLERPAKTNIARISATETIYSPGR